MLNPGTRFDAYLIGDILGRGSFGAVYRAYDTVELRPVALKVLSGDAPPDGNSSERFLAEAQMLTRLSHPHIVRAYRAGRVDGSLFLAIELIEGPSLAHLMATGRPLAPAQVAQLLPGLGGAIDYLHAAGLVHRDIKSTNVMLRDTGEPVLLDFGIARRVYEAPLTPTGLRLGSLETIAPEQVAGAPAGPAADIYALAALSYRLLTGAPLFGGKQDEVLHAHLRMKPVPLEAVCPGLPEEVYRVIGASLAKEPASRPILAAAISDAFASLRCRDAREGSYQGRSSIRDDVSPPTVVGHVWFTPPARMEPLPTTIMEHLESLHPEEPAAPATGGMSEPPLSEAPMPLAATVPLVVSRYRRQVVRVAVALGAVALTLGVGALAFARLRPGTRVVQAAPPAATSASASATQLLDSASLPSDPAPIATPAAAQPIAPEVSATAAPGPVVLASPAPTAAAIPSATPAPPPGPAEVFRRLVSSRPAAPILPAAFAVTAVDNGEPGDSRRTHHVVGTVEVDLSGPDVQDSLFYNVFASDADAAGYFGALVPGAGVVRLNDQYTPTGFAYPITCLDQTVAAPSGATLGETVCDVLAGNVEILSATFRDDVETAGNRDNTLALAHAGIRHLEELEAPQVPGT